MTSRRLREEISCVIFDDDTPTNHAPKSENRYDSYKGELVAFNGKEAPELWDKARAASGLKLSDIEARQLERADGRRMTAEEIADHKQREREAGKRARAKRKAQMNAAKQGET